MEENMQNQCSVVIRIDGKQIEIPVTFGMTSDEIRMVYPFLLQMMNDKLENPIMQFNRAKERGDFNSMPEDEYNRQLHRVVSQARYWYEKPEAGLLDIAMRFAVDIKLRGISDLESLFRIVPEYRPYDIRPVTEEEAFKILQNLKLADETPDDIEDFGTILDDNIADDIIDNPPEIEVPDDSSEPVIEEVDEDFEEPEDPEDNNISRDENDINGGLIDVILSGRDADSDAAAASLIDKLSEENGLTVDSSRYESDYDPNRGITEDDITDDGLLNRPYEEESPDDISEESSENISEELSDDNNSDNIPGNIPDTSYVEPLFGLGIEMNDDPYNSSENPDEEYAPESDDDNFDAESDGMLGSAEDLDFDDNNDENDGNNDDAV